MIHAIHLHRDVVRAIYCMACEFVPARSACPSDALDRIDQCQQGLHHSIYALAAALATVVLRERLFPVANNQAAWLIAYTLLAINKAAPDLEQTDAFFLIRDASHGAIGQRQLANALRYGRALPGRVSA